MTPGGTVASQSDSQVLKIYWYVQVGNLCLRSQTLTGVQYEWEIRMMSCNGPENCGKQFTLTTESFRQVNLK